MQGPNLETDFLPLLVRKGFHSRPTTRQGTLGFLSPSAIQGVNTYFCSVFNELGVCVYVCVCMCVCVCVCVCVCALLEPFLLV